MVSVDEVRSFSKRWQTATSDRTSKVTDNEETLPLQARCSDGARHRHRDVVRPTPCQRQRGLGDGVGEQSTHDAGAADGWGDVQFLEGDAG
jgi:hypothetical protein